MLPLIPFEVLVPLVIAATSLCLALILWIIGRRALLHWWSRGGRRQIEQAEALLRRARRDGNGARRKLLAWLRRGGPGRLDSLVIAVARVARDDAEVRRWIANGSGVPLVLAEIITSKPKSLPGARWMHRWTRVAAARAAGELGMHGALRALVSAMDDPDTEVGYAAADALARLNQPQAADAILHRITAQPRLNNARLAALIERMDCDLTAQFRAHLERADSQALFWTATLIGQKHVPELVLQVQPLLAAPDANVRAASCECIGELRVPLSDQWLAPLLGDEQWFVQSHAARALGDLQATWAIDELVRLLDSPEWWVRQNAADALVKLGSAAEPAVETLLDASDRFARNTAVEILERIGWVDRMLQRIDVQEASAVRLLRQFGSNGGLGYLENALFTAPEFAVPALLRILGELGDDATYGRLRAAAEQLPAHLRPATYAVAAEVRGR